MFYFKYIVENLKDAQEHGFSLLISFPQINATYEYHWLFALFSTRLPDSSRPEIKKILATYGMTEYGEFELLKRSGEKLPTNNYEFVIQKISYRVVINLKLNISIYYETI